VCGRKEVETSYKKYLNLLGQKAPIAKKEKHTIWTYKIHVKYKNPLVPTSSVGGAKRHRLHEELLSPLSVKSSKPSAERVGIHFLI